MAAEDARLRPVFADHRDQVPEHIPVLRKPGAGMLWTKLDAIDIAGVKSAGLSDEAVQNHQLWWISATTRRLHFGYPAPTSAEIYASA